VTALVARAIEAYGRIDITINNAATNPHFGALLTADDSQWDKIMDTNVKGAFRVCRRSCPHGGAGRRQDRQSVLCRRAAAVAGDGSVRHRESGLIMLTQQLAMELGRANIQVNAIAPRSDQDPLQPNAVADARHRRAES